MYFENRLKKELSQGIFKCLLEDCEYRVIPLGIEAVIREVACLDQQSYMKLNFSEAIRHLPDFCVLDQPQKNKYIVEVKYRWNWDASVFNELIEQVKMFKELYFVLFLGNPPASDYTEPSTYLRCCRLFLNDQENVCAEVKASTGNTKERISVNIELDDLSKLQWWNLCILQHYFLDLSKSKQGETLKKAIRSINGILNERNCS